MNINGITSEHPGMHTDRLLVEQACTGDTLAFETLVQLYQGTLYRFAQAHVGSEQAHDVVQFVWLQLYRSLPVLQGSAERAMQDLPLKHWLLRVAWNRCVDEMRWQARHPWLLFSQLDSEDGALVLYALLDTASTPEEYVERKNEQECLRKAIELLPPLPRAIVWLRYTRALNFSEIGHQLHIPPTTAKTYFHRARTKLRAALENYGYDDRYHKK